MMCHILRGKGITFEQTYNCNVMCEAGVKGDGYVSYKD